MPRQLRPAVYVEVLGRGNHPEVARIISLQSGHISHRHPSRQEWIFAVGLLPASPPWIAKDIDVGRPEVQPRMERALPFAHSFFMLDTAFDADVHRHLVNALRIERSAQADGLGILRRSVQQHAMQRLAPPVVSRHVQPRNGPRMVDHLAGLFLQSHLRHKIGRTLRRRQCGVQIIRLLRLLRARRAHHSESRPASTRPLVIHMFSSCSSQSVYGRATLSRHKKSHFLSRSHSNLREKPLSSGRL